MEQIILYSNDCPQCKVLKAKLNEKNITFIEVNNIDAMLAKGFRSMPVLEVDGETMKYADALKWTNKQTTEGEITC